MIVYVSAIEKAGSHLSSFMMAFLEFNDRGGSHYMELFYYCKLASVLYNRVREVSPTLVMEIEIQYIYIFTYPYPLVGLCFIASMHFLRVKREVLMFPDS